MTSCSLLKTVPKSVHNNNDGPFMNQVSITVEPTSISNKISSNIRDDKVEIKDKKANITYNRIEDIEQYLPSAFRYSLLLDIEVEAIKNQRLFEYIL